MLRLYTFVALLHVLIGWRLVPDLPWLPAALVVAGWLAASTVVAPFSLYARRLQSARWSRFLSWAGLLALGSFSSLFVLTILRDVVLLVVALIGFMLDWGGATRPVHAYTALAVPMLAALLTLIGFINARRPARVRTVEVPIEDLPSALHGFTIVQISDMHVGPTIKRNYVDAIVDAVNRLEADLIAVTGDLVDGSVSELAHHTQPMSRLSARHGSYFVTGNHEYYSGAGAWIAEMRRLGLRVLLNEHVVVEHEGEEIVVAGVTDYSAHYYDQKHRSDPRAALSGAPEDAAFKLLLAHQPRSALAAHPAGFDLQLSGHTHGGQFLPWNFFVRFQQPFTAGLHRLGTLWVYTSRGTGYWGPPKRLGAPSEITRLRLIPA